MTSLPTTLTIEVLGTTINVGRQIWEFPREKSPQDRKEKGLHIFRSALLVERRHFSGINALIRAYA